jgi:putative ATP-binding cassette transporter
MSNAKNKKVEDNEEENITLWSMAKRLYRLYRPYFGFSAKNRKRTLWLGGVVLGNTLLAFSLAFVNVSMAALMGLIAIPGVTYTAFFFAAAQFLTAIVSYGFLTGIDAWMASLLGSSLTHAINKDIEKKWMKGKAYYGMTLRKRGGQNPSQILSHDNHQMNATVMELFDNFLTTVSNAVVGFIGLYMLSVPLGISIFSFSFAIPGYLVASTVIYALIYNGITNKMGDSLENLQTRQRKVEGKIVTKVHHIRAQAEAIAFKKGTQYEHDSLKATIKNNKIVQRSAAKIRSLLSFLTNLHAEFTSFFAILLCAPNIIAQKLSFANILEIPYHFQNVVNMFTWKSDNFDKVTECAVSLKRIEELHGSLNKWEKLQKDNKSNLAFTKGTKNALEIKNLTLRRPDGLPILHNFSCSIPKGKVTLLQGPSGVGKTSILRALARISPYAKGQIRGLTGKTHFVPSHPYFPMNRSLLEAIMYPRKQKATPQEIHKIKQLMRELGLKPTHIRDLEKVKDWSGQDLSDGEKQRVEIISAIMDKPDNLLMDEATSRVDHDAKTDNKGKIERAIKKHLPKATVIFTDHNPSEGEFCDNKIYLSSNKRRRRA